MTGPSSRETFGSRFGTFVWGAGGSTSTAESHLPPDAQNLNVESRSTSVSRRETRVAAELDPTQRMAPAGKPYARLKMMTDGKIMIIAATIAEPRPYIRVHDVESSRPAMKPRIRLSQTTVVPAE